VYVCACVYACVSVRGRIFETAVCICRRLFVSGAFASLAETLNMYRLHSY